MAMLMSRHAYSLDAMYILNRLTSKQIASYFINSIASYNSYINLTSSQIAQHSIKSFTETQHNLLNTLHILF